MHSNLRQQTEKKKKLHRRKGKDKKWHQTSAWRPACNLTPVASYITCHQSLSEIYFTQPLSNTCMFSCLSKLH